MEFIKIHQVLGDLRKDSNQFFIDVSKVDITPEEIEKMRTHPDIKAAMTRVEGPINRPFEYYRVLPGGWSYRWEEAKAKYGFLPREAVGERPSDHVLYVMATPKAIKYFKNQFTSLAQERESTRPYIKYMLGKVDMVLIGAQKLDDKDKEALINL